MKCVRSTAVVGILALAVWLSGGRVALAQDAVPPPPPDADVAIPRGMDVLTTGPIHEAFAAPVTTQPQITPVVPKAPPPPIDEVPADQRPAGDNVVWIPGYWGWDTDRSDFVWVSGFWRMPPPGRQWVPGHWDQLADGWHWVPGFWGEAQQTQLAYLPQPPAPVQAAPSVPAPGANAIFEPSTWVYADNRYAWRPGYWVNYRPGWVWVPAHYVWTPAGYVFVDGYWDYPLQQRGLLFTPVYFSAPLYQQPGFSYRPYYVVRDLALFGALFLRTAMYHYYFGNYFGPQYQRLGYQPWFDYRLGGTGYDPLFGYYRFAQPNGQRWVTSLRELYTARYNGTAQLPPRTLAQQQALVAAAGRNAPANALRSLALVTPITKVSPSVVKLQPVSPQMRAAEQRLARQYREASQQRRQHAAQVRTQAPANAAGSRAVHVTLPRLPTPKPSPTLQPPATPTRPKPQPHPPAPAVHPQSPKRPEPRPQPAVKPPARPQPAAPAPARPAQPPHEVHPQPAPRPAARPQPAAPHPAPQPTAHPQPQPPAHPQPRPAAAPKRPPANPHPAPPPPRERRPEHEKK